MSKVRNSGNSSTELRLIALFRAHDIANWRRGRTIRARVVGKGVGTSKDTRHFKVRPDFVFRSRKLAVFVDGCFWHGCPSHGRLPKQNTEFWRAKIRLNRERDRLVTRTLRAAGWKVVRIWEHDLAPKKERKLLIRIAACIAHANK